MNKQGFISSYIATFLATYAAQNYDMNCLAGKTAEQYHHPVEDAAVLADAAWKEVSKSLT
jgi:hypothetical protein